MESYQLLLRGDPDRTVWVLARVGIRLSLAAPDGRPIFDAEPAHRIVDLDALYAEKAVRFIPPHDSIAFRRHEPALAALRAAVETGLAGDADFRAERRRGAWRRVWDGLVMFVVAGGLFGLYCWWTWSAEDPPPGTWQRWVLVQFGWLIHGVLLVLMGFALAGPCVSVSGLRQLFRLRRIARSAITTARCAGPADAPYPTLPYAYRDGLLTESSRPEGPARPKARRFQLECPRCASARVEKLPPDSISPHPGYRCAECGAKMRDTGMLFPYLVALGLGSGVAALFLYLMLVGEGEKRMPAQGLWFVGVGLICAGYALLQMMRPVPRRQISEEDLNEPGCHLPATLEDDQGIR